MDANTTAWRNMLKKVCSRTDFQKNAQNIHTPFDLCFEIIEKFDSYAGVFNKTYLVMNIEFIEVLVQDFGISKENITFITDCPEKAAIMKHERYKGVNVIVGNFLELESKMKKFNVVVMNPPYQISDGGHSRSSKPLYNLFIEKAIDDLRPDYLLSINPSRWMVGGKGLDSFRKKMINDKRIKMIVDSMSPSGLFHDVEIAGGVNYFLWDKSYNGKCQFNGVERFLDEEDIVIRENESRSILQKVKNKTTDWIYTSVSPLKPYGLRGDTEVAGTGTPCWFKQSIGLAFVDSSLVKNPKKDLHLWRVLVPRAPIAGQTDLTESIMFFSDSNIIIAKPGECCTETYVVLKSLATEKHAKNFVSYLKTRFFRFMLKMRVISQDVTRESYKWVPDMNDYSKEWADSELYKMFDLTKAEINYIESKIKESK